MDKDNDILGIFIPQKNEIIEKWLTSNDVLNFFEKFSITSDEKQYYFTYLGDKIFTFFVTNFGKGLNEYDLTIKLISTKSFDLIQSKNAGIEDILELIIAFKHTLFLFEGYKDVGKMLSIAKTFDNIIKIFSQDYNNNVLKLLNQYKLAIDKSSIISKTNVKGIITYTNEKFCRLSGYKSEEMIGKPHNIVRHPDMPSQIFKEMWEKIQSKEIWSGIIKNKNKDGGSYWAKTTIVPILDNMDNILEYICIRTDITELKEALKNVEEYNNALDKSSMVVKLDSDFNIKHANDSFLNKLFLEKNDILGKYFFKQNNIEEIDTLFSVPINKEVTLKKIYTDVNEKGTWSGILRFKINFYEFLWASATIIPFYGIDDQILEYIIILNDISEMEIIKQNLNLSYHKLQELDKKKDEFLNIASHELRTPITAIIGYISMMMDGDMGKLNPNMENALKNTFESSQRLLEIVNDMFDISRIESGTMFYNFEKLEVRLFLVNLYNDMLFLAKNRDINFNLELSDDLRDIYISVDKNKLIQIISNLITNAFKFTNSGGNVTIRASVKDKKVLFEVIDTGIGIAKDKFEKILSKFYQLDSYAQRRAEGLGLGLALCQLLISKFSSKIELESEIGKGSNFYFYIDILNLS